MKYNHIYKYCKINNTNDLIIEISLENTMGKYIYCARSKKFYCDEDGDRCNASGVGDDELIAVKMCLNEINRYERCQKNKCDYMIEDLVEIKQKYEITFLNKYNKYFTINYEKNGDSIIVFSNKKKETINVPNVSIVETLFEKFKSQVVIIEVTMSKQILFRKK